MCSSDRIAEPSERGTVIRLPSRSLAGAKQQILPFSPRVTGTLLQALAGCKTTVSAWLCRHVPDAASLALRQLQLVAKAPHACCQHLIARSRRARQLFPSLPSCRGTGSLTSARSVHAEPARYRISRTADSGCRMFQLWERAWSHGASRPSRLAISRQVPGNPCPRPARATRSWRPLPARQARCAGTRNPLLRHASA